MPTSLNVTSHAASKQPAHASLTTQQVSDLVETFYGHVRANERLAPLFDNQMQRDWETHLEMMKMFWRSVLLKSAEYHGKPVPAHARLQGVETSDFKLWLGLFRETVEEVFEPEARSAVISAAERIATSLWLAMHGNALSTPPDWSQQ